MNEELRELLVERKELKEMEEQLAERLDDWKKRTMPLMLALEIDKCGEEGVGTMTVVNGTSSTINGGKLREALLKRGMAPEIVAAVVEEATTKNHYTTLSFRKSVEVL